MQPAQIEEFKGYLSSVFIEMQNITEYDAEPFFKKFLENIQSKRLPFRDLEALKMDEIFKEHPSFETLLTSICNFFKTIAVKDKTDIVTIAEAYLATLKGSEMQLDETQIDDLRKVGPIKWLQTVLNDLAKSSGMGGTCEVSSPEKDKVVVTVHGDLAVQYSARLFLTTFSDNLPVLSEPSTEQANYSFPLIMVRALQRHHYKLKLFQTLMSQHGYEITIPGNKDCKTELFVDNTAFAQESDADLRKEWGISLSVAQALEKCEGKVVFPMTAQLRVKDAKQREQFKVYFKNTNILNFDKTAPKQFIVANNGRETLCCNIATNHAQILWDYFLRLDTIAKKGQPKSRRAY